MKKVIIIVVAVIGGLAVLGGVIVGGVFWLTGGAVEAGEQFLTLISEERMQEAYAETAAAFQSQQDVASFTAIVTEIGLTDYESASWTNRQIQNNRATLEGSVTTVDGGTIPLTIELVSENDEWKVLGLTAPMAGAAIAGAAREPGAPMAPDGDAVRELVNDTMRSFSDSLQRHDFAPFYETISDRWQAQISADELGRVFQPLVEQGTDFGNIQRLDPTFDEPAAIDQDGLLVASGFYPSEPNQARFEVSYIYEDPNWKLFGIHIAPETSGGSAGGPGAEPASTAQVEEPAASQAGDAGDAYTVVENPELTGRLGRIVVAFPEGTDPSSTRIVIRPSGGGDDSAANYGGITADLLPGTYDVVISDVVIPAVEVRSRHDTEIAVGVLRVAAGSSTRVQVIRGGEVVASGYGNMQVGLPAGVYEVEISGQREEITIVRGETVEF
jgi:hypothetical protein